MYKDGINEKCRENNISFCTEKKKQFIYHYLDDCSYYSVTLNSTFRNNELTSSSLHAIILLNTTERFQLD